MGLDVADSAWSPVYSPSPAEELHWVWQEVANRTGGFTKSDNSFPIHGVRDVIRDLSAYYVVSFRPAPGSFDEPFNSLKVRLKRPGLRVLAAAGFFGVDPTLPPLAGEDALAGALASPFSYQDLDVRLTSPFIRDPNHGSTVRSWLLLDVSRLTFLDEVDGAKSASLEAQIGLFKTGSSGDIRHRSTRDLYFAQSNYQRALAKGFVFNVFCPPLPPGDYFLRVALMDRSSKRIGSAYQLVEVPDLKKKQLTLSGILLAEKVIREEDNANSSAGEADPDFGPGVRRFKRGMKVQFGCAVYNPPRDKRTGGGQGRIRPVRRRRPLSDGQGRRAPPGRPGVDRPGDPTRARSGRTHATLLRLVLQRRPRQAS